jgi:hypothetical protein
LSLFATAISCPAAGAEQATSLYGVFEQAVKNDNTYSNPFDFRVIELRARFTAPSGKMLNFWGFYDGDGIGGQTGNVWKCRCMPDEVGTWKYSYAWSDGTPGGEGTFEVADTGLAGPLKVATDNPWYSASRSTPVRTGCINI